MAEQPSAENCFKSRAGGGWISAAQFIAETMCLRMGRKQGKDLPPKFWNQTAWKRAYLIQVIKANALLNLYDRKALFNALKRLKFLLTLNNKMVLDPVLMEEQEKLDAAAKRAEENPVAAAEPAPVVTEKPREIYNPRQSMLAKLRSLDG